MGPVPDVALPSSPTSSVSSSGVPPEYFQMDQSLEALNDEGSSGSSWHRACLFIYFFFFVRKYKYMDIF